jgi:hypothetical protein
MIVWLNGTFGAGKTATELTALPWLRREADTVVDTAGVDPDTVAGRIAAAVRG